MKKLIIGCAAGSLLLVAGCSSSKDHFQYPEEVTASSVIENTYNVGYQLSVNADENKVHIAVSLENPLNVEMPLITDENGNLFDIRIEDSDGNIIEQFYLEKGARDSLANKEKTQWETTVDVNRDETITVHSKILLKSNEQTKYNLSNETQEVSVEVKTAQIARTSLMYTPKEPVDYIYKTKSDEEVVERFRYMNKNRIQSFTEEEGVKIYSNEADGLYVLVTGAATEDIDGTDYVETSEMDLLVPYYVEEGFEWIIDSKKYKLSDADVRVKTPYESYQGAVEITETDKKGNKKYLYFDKDVGLLKVKQKNKKQLVSKTVYELVDIKERTGTVK